MLLSHHIDDNATIQTIIVKSWYTLHHIIVYKGFFRFFPLFGSEEIFFHFTTIFHEKEEKQVGRVGVEPTTPAMSRRYPNQARPPAQYTLKKFAAQIYVVDRLYMETN